MSLNKYSKAVTQDPTQPAAKAMLHAIGLTTKDLSKPFVGIASTGYEGNPCNLDELNCVQVDDEPRQPIVNLLMMIGLFKRIFSILKTVH